MVSRVKRFFLEIKDFSNTIDLNLPENYKIILDDKNDFQLNKFFYKQKGMEHYWRNRILWSDKEWIKYVTNKNLETHVLKKGEDFVGYYEQEYHPDSNEDRMLGKILSMTYSKENRISFTIPDSTGDNHWFDIANLGDGCKFFVWHGDNIRGHSGFPWYGFGKKLLGWKALASRGLMPDFDYAIAGHWHTPTTMYVNDIRLWVNGSTESYNTYALEQLASMGRPCQWLLFVKPGDGVTAEYLVKLTHS